MPVGLRVVERGRKEALKGYKADKSASLWLWPGEEEREEATAQTHRLRTFKCRAGESLALPVAPLPSESSGSTSIDQNIPSTRTTPSQASSRAVRLVGTRQEQRQRRRATQELSVRLASPQQRHRPTRADGKKAVPADITPPAFSNLAQPHKRSTASSQDCSRVDRRRTTPFEPVHSEKPRSPHRAGSPDRPEPPLIYHPQQVTTSITETRRKARRLDVTANLSSDAHLTFLSFDQPPQTPFSAQRADARMALVDESDLSEQPSSSPSAGSTVPLPSSELGSPHGRDRDRATSPRPAPSGSRVAKTGPGKMDAIKKPIKASHSRNNSNVSAVVSAHQRGKKGKSAATSSRAGSLAATDRLSVKAKSVPPMSRKGSAMAGDDASPAAAIEAPSAAKLSRVSSTADSPSPPHHLNTSHGELPLFEQPIILEGSRSRRIATSQPLPSASSASTSSRRKATAAAVTGPAPGKRKAASTASPAPKRSMGGGKSAGGRKSGATDGDSSLTEQESSDDDQEDVEGSSSSAPPVASGTKAVAAGLAHRAKMVKGTKRPRAVVDDDDDEDETAERQQGEKPNGSARRNAKLVSSATSTSLSEAGSDSVVPSSSAPTSKRAPEASHARHASLSGNGSASASSSSNSIPMRNVHRSPHAALFQGETERWGLPPGEARGRRTAAAKSRLGQDSPTVDHQGERAGSGSRSRRTTGPGSGATAKGGGSGKRRRLSSGDSTLTPDGEDRIAKKEDVDILPTPSAVVAASGATSIAATPSEEPTHFAMPQVLAASALMQHSSRGGSPDDSSSRGSSASANEEGPSPPTPLPPHGVSDTEGGIGGVGVEVEGGSKGLDDVIDAAAVVGDGGLQGMDVDGEGETVEMKGMDALQSLVDAATGELAEDEGDEVLAHDGEAEDEEDAEDEKAATPPQVVVVEAPIPMKTRNAKTPPEPLDAQDAYNIKRTEATEKLARIEIAFATLRNRLYVERTADVLREKSAVEAGVHPELNAYVEMLESKRDRRLEQARKRFEAREQALERGRVAAETSIWTHWNEEKVGMRSEMVAETHRQLRQLEREKNQPEMLRPYVESQLAPREILPGAPSLLGGGRRKQTSEEREAEAEEDLAVALRLAVAGRAVADLSSLPEEDRMVDLQRMTLRPAAKMDAAQAAREAAEITSLYGGYYAMDPMLGYTIAAAVQPETALPPPQPATSTNRPQGEEKRHHRRPTLDTVMQERPRSFAQQQGAFFVPAAPSSPIRQY